MVSAAFVFAVASGFMAAALPTQLQLTTNLAVVDECPAKTSPAAQETYYADGDEKAPTGLRISNGGAGLSGLVEALSRAFIAYKYKLDQYQGSEPRHFKIEWIKGDTTETLQYLSAGQVDVGITYNKPAECQAIRQKAASKRVYGFRDHFYLVGPELSRNPAKLKEYKKGSQENEDVLDQFQAIVRTGNEDLNPPTRFLSRYDKSATNIKESELFIRVGQVPWAYAYSKWYHQYPRYPIDALETAASLQEYTITDRGTWLSTEESYREKLVRYNEGTDDPDHDKSDSNKEPKPSDPLLNPGFFLSSSKSCPETLKLANEFLDWVIGEEGQSVIGNFTGKLGGTEKLYTRAPTREDLPIKSCDVAGM